METGTQGETSADGRISKDQYYLNIAREVAKRSTCLRRNFGAVVVKNEQIVSTGYGGAPRKTVNCLEVGTCIRSELGAKKGEHYEWCRAVHAEQNAIIHASRAETFGATLYLVGLKAKTWEVMPDAEPCRICKRMIVNAGLERVVIQAGDTIRREAVDIWVADNLGELRNESGRLVPVKPRGYE